MTKTQLSSIDLDERTGVIDFDALQHGDDGDITAMDKEAEIEAAMDEEGEAKEGLLESEDPTRKFQYPLVSQVKAPGGIPHQCVKQMWSQALWYRKLRSIFLVSEFEPFQCGSLRGFLGLHFERFRHLSTHPFVIHPYSDFSAIWNFSIGLLIGINLMYGPYLIAFQPLTFVDPHILRASFFLSSMLLIDMILTFCTGSRDYYSHKVILEPRKIAYNYVTGWFFYDLITRFPTDAVMILFLSDEDRLIKTKLDAVRIVAYFSRIFRYQKVYQVLCRVAETFSFRSMVTPWILKLLVLIIFTIHFLACFHWLLPDIVNSHLDQPKHMSWITNYDIWDKSYFIQYSNAYLRSLSNLLTLDGGTYIPREPEEILCTIVGIFLSVSMFGYFISSFSTLLSQINASAEKYDQMLDLIEVYLKFQKIPLKLQSKIFQFLEKKHRGHMFSDAAILGTLSPNLITEICCHNCRVLVQKVPLFNKLPPGVIVSLVERLEYEVYVPGDVLVTIDTPGDCMYFIQDGDLDVLSRFGDKVASLRDGDFFGEIALICKEKHINTVVAAAPCEIYKLSRDNFRHCVESCEDIYSEILAVAQGRLELDRNKAMEVAEKAEKLRNWRKQKKELNKILEEENAIVIDTTKIQLVGGADEEDDNEEEDGDESESDDESESEYSKTTAGEPSLRSRHTVKPGLVANLFHGDGHQKLAAIKTFFKKASIKKKK